MRTRFRFRRTLSAFLPVSLITEKAICALVATSRDPSAVHLLSPIRQKQQ
jgi:hypothetical protein